MMAKNSKDEKTEKIYYLNTIDKLLREYSVIIDEIKLGKRIVNEEDIKLMKIEVQSAKKKFYELTGTNWTFAYKAPELPNLDYSDIDIDLDSIEEDDIDIK